MQFRRGALRRCTAGVCNLRAWPIHEFCKYTECTPYKDNVLDVQYGDTVLNVQGQCTRCTETLYLMYSMYGDSVLDVQGQCTRCTETVYSMYGESVLDARGQCTLSTFMTKCGDSALDVWVQCN